MIEKRFDPRNTPEHLTYNLYKAPSAPPPPSIYTGYWLKVIRYCVIPKE